MGCCWCNREPMGLTLSAVTWIALAFADCTVSQFIIRAWFETKSPRFRLVPLSDAGMLVFALYQLLILTTILSHISAGTTDPGSITEEHPEIFDAPKFCARCERKTQTTSWKPPRAHHCKTCDRCIFRMDHHCMWINNCVGYRNQKLFILFLGYTCITAVVTLLLLVVSVCAWFATQDSLAEAGLPNTYSLIFGGILVVVCIGAMIFVSEFFREQMESIESNTTLVETYQHTHGAKMSSSEYLRMIFGDNWLLWPIPIVSCRPADFSEPVFPDHKGEMCSPLSEIDADELGVAHGQEREKSTVSRRPGGRLQNNQEMEYKVH
mmetsp:Transcript_68781/g.107641  ORF Transcript_68781/g.107641 Transcript_68781/m.107641 type:complete len:322 (+) Transcript_68781:51-1016(+)